MDPSNWIEHCQWFDEACRDFKFPPAVDDRVRQCERYYKLLKRFDFEAVKAGWFAAGMKYKDFPTVAQLIELIEAGRPVSKAEAERKARVGRKAREVNGRFLRGLLEVFEGPINGRRAKFQYFQEEVLPGLVAERREADRLDRGGV